MRLFLLCVALLGQVGSAGATTYYLLKDGAPYRFGIHEARQLDQSGLVRRVPLPGQDVQRALQADNRYIPIFGQEPTVEERANQALVDKAFATLSQRVGPEASAEEKRRLNEKFPPPFAKSNAQWYRPSVIRLGLEGAIDKTEQRQWKDVPFFTARMLRDKGGLGLTDKEIDPSTIVLSHVVRNWDSGGNERVILSTLKPIDLLQEMLPLDALFLQPLLSASAGTPQKPTIAFSNTKCQVLGGFLLDAPADHIAAAFTGGEVTFYQDHFYREGGWKNVVSSVAKGFSSMQEMRDHEDAMNGIQNELLIAPVLSEAACDLRSVAINAVFVKVDPKRDDVDWKSPETWPSEYKKYWDLANTPTQNCPWDCYKRDCTEHHSSLPLVLIDESDTLSAVA